MSARFRLNRLLASDGRCFDVAIDHGVFGEPTFLGGIEDMRRAVQAVIVAGPDAIQLAPGQAALLQGSPQRHKPALVLRTDTTNVYGPTRPRVCFSQLLDDAVEQAVRLDAAAVVVNLLLLPDAPELLQACLANVARLVPACRRFGMPLMVEPIAMKPAGGGLAVDGDPQKVVPLVRQAVELGADLIKADPPEDAAAFRQVVDVAGEVPVLVRGGGKADEAQILQRTHALMQTGARGIVYGRNVIQHPNPTAMTRAFMAIVHDGVSAEAALAILRQGA